MKIEGAHCIGAGAGLGYGLFLSTAGLLLAGFGHGSYLAIGLFAAPLPFIGYGAAFFGAPLLWAATAFAVMALRNSPLKWLLAAALVLHYGAAYAFIQFRADRLDWLRLQHWWNEGGLTRIFIVFASALYLLGQLVTWFVLLSPVRRKPGAPR